MIKQAKHGSPNPIDEALAQAGEDVLDRARRHNTPIVVWRNGKVVHLDPWTQKPVNQREPPQNKPTGS